MDGEWLQYGMLFATLALAVISVTATVINYLVFRTIVDPQIAVYVEHETERPTILILVVENIGKGVARNVRFEFSRPLPGKAFGVELESAKPAAPMSEGPLIDGIPTLGPGGMRVITWGQFGGLQKALGGRSIQATVRWESRSWHPFDPQQHVAHFDLEVNSFAATDASRSNLLLARRALEDIHKDLQKLERALMSQIRRVASAVEGLVDDDDVQDGSDVG